MKKYRKSDFGGDYSIDINIGIISISIPVLYRNTITPILVISASKPFVV